MPGVSRSDPVIVPDDYFIEAHEAISLLLEQTPAVHRLVLQVLLAALRVIAGETLYRSDLDRLRAAFTAAVDAASSQPIDI